MQLVEVDFGNLAIGITTLKQAMKGLDVVKATEILGQFESSLVESLQDARVHRHLRGLPGTVSVLLQRLDAICGEQLREATKTLLAVITVLNPIGVFSLNDVWEVNTILIEGSPPETELMATRLHRGCAVLEDRQN